MITKSDIDDYITTNYEYLKVSVKKIKYKSCYYEFDESELIAFTYEHLIKKLNKMKSKSDIEAFFFIFCKNQVKREWNNSEFSKVLFGKRKDLFMENFYDDYDMIDDFEDFDNKIAYEINYNEIKTLIYQFSKTLSNEDRIFFEVMSNGKFNTIKKLSEHFKINKNYIGQTRKRISNSRDEYIKLNFKRYEN